MDERTGLQNAGQQDPEDGATTTAEAADAPADEVPDEVEMVHASPLLELLIEQHAARGEPLMPSRIEGIVVGQVADVRADGTVMVSFVGTPAAGIAARSMLTLAAADRGRSVAIMFEGSDSSRPVVMGPIVTPAINQDGEPYVAAADGRRVDISAAEEIVLRCGESSITLTREGKVEIRGLYVLSRSSGVNRIQGGAVEVN